MALFSGLLLASDFDDTLLPTSRVRGAGAPPRSVSEENRAALAYFIAEGGRFTVSTGRSAATFAPFAAALPMNAPAIVSGGGALYDYGAKRYLAVTHLPDRAAADLADLARRFPAAALELYHEDEVVWVVHPNEFSENHRRITGTVLRPTASVSAVAAPFHKALFEGEDACLEALYAALAGEGLLAHYEAVFASPHMLELTAKGADKGAMLLRLGRQFGVRREDLCAVGDHRNDLPILKAAGRAFAPANAVAEVRALPGITVVRSAESHALQDVVARLAHERH